MMFRAMLACASAIAFFVAAPGSARAQGQCQTTGGDVCQTQANNQNSISLTITRATRLELSSTNIALLAATAGAFDTTFGETAGFTLTVKSNQSWAVTTRVTSGSWIATPLGGSGATPRANKPAADLSWATSSGGSFTPYSTTDTQLQASGAATPGTVIPLFFRVQYAWTLDTPGVYTIPIQFTVIAP